MEHIENKHYDEKEDSDFEPDTDASDEECDDILEAKKKTSKDTSKHDNNSVPFQCEYCDKSFPRKDTRKRHQETVHRGKARLKVKSSRKLLYCNVCPYATSNHHLLLYSLGSAFLCHMKTCTSSDCRCVMILDWYLLFGTNHCCV